MADLQGYLLISKPPTTGEAQWVEHLGSLAKEAGEAFAHGGTISAEEVHDLELRREVAEAMEALARIDKALEAVERGEM